MMCSDLRLKTASSLSWGGSPTSFFNSKCLFTHDQLYVALSRVGDQKSMQILAKNSCFTGIKGHYANNVVFPEVL